jgi:hypothetical protein
MDVVRTSISVINVVEVDNIYVVLLNKIMIYFE